MLASQVISRGDASHFMPLFASLRQPFSFHFSSFTAFLLFVAYFLSSAMLLYFTA